MKIRAYAKINLGLNIVKRLPNGYHDLDMIMVPIDLYDTLDIEVSNNNVDELTSINNSLIIDSDNTIYKAINILRNSYNFKEYFKIILEKNIPSQAGLGGGSADAAAILHYLNIYLKLNLTIDELITIGLQVGADVPFCILNHCARVKGVGELLQPFNIKPIGAILIKGTKGVSTPLAFKTTNIISCAHPNMDLLQSTLAQQDYETSASISANSLEESSFIIEPTILNIKNTLKQLDFKYILMSGSGACVYALSDDYDKLYKASLKLRSTYEFVKITTILNEVNYATKQ